MLEKAIVTVQLAEDLLCHMTCEFMQADEDHTSVDVKHYHTVEESRYEDFARMMMLMKDHEKEILNTLFKEIEGKDEHYLIINGLLISYYREMQPQQ